MILPRLLLLLLAFLASLAGSVSPAPAPAITSPDCSSPPNHADWPDWFDYPNTISFYCPHGVDHDCFVAVCGQYLADAAAKNLKYQNEWKVCCQIFLPSDPVAFAACVTETQDRIRHEVEDLQEQCLGALLLGCCKAAE